MARRFGKIEGNKPHGSLCNTCGDEMPQGFWGRRGAQGESPVHCVASEIAWGRGAQGAHHGRERYPSCWKCRGSIGCDQCAGTKSEALCKRCGAWVFPEGLAAHGPILNSPMAMVYRRRGKVAPQLDKYPPEFQSAYQLSFRQDLNFQPPSLKETVAEIAAKMEF